MHRFSPYSTRAIKGRKNGVRKKKIHKVASHSQLENELSDDELVWQLLSLGYSFDQSIGCLSYIEKKTINCAIDFFEKNEN
jgi:hypothetical protein